jgi:hypothetical protein
VHGRGQDLGQWTDRQGPVVYSMWCGHEEKVGIRHVDEVRAKRGEPE